jgi:truncated hemoglobin YjbI
MTNARASNLFLTIGGSATVEVIVDQLYERLSADEMVGHYFHPDRLALLKAAQRAWFQAALSGQEELPSDLASAHAHLVITDAEVSVVLGHLAAILAQTSLSTRIQHAVLSLVRRLWYARQF